MKENFTNLVKSRTLNLVKVPTTVYGTLPFIVVWWHSVPVCGLDHIRFLKVGFNTP